MSHQKLARVKAELAGIKKNPSPGIHVYLEDESNMEEFKVEMVGPEGSPYQNGIFTLRVNIPDRYPFIPPVITFITQVYHPNIDPTGRICLQPLKAKPAGNWSVTLNIITLLASIRILLKEPNLQDPLMGEIAAQYSTDYSAYFEEASRQTKLHAKPT